MKIQSSSINKYAFLFLAGGSVYHLIEIIYRGHSHWTMFVLGGICFIAVGLINNLIDWDMPLVLQMLLGSAIITTLEFATGCIVNIWLKWDIWNYSNPFNLLGQISLPSSIGWFFLSSAAIVLDDYLRYWFFNGKKPHYKLV